MPSDKEKDEDILSLGTNSKNDDVIKTNILGFPVKLDALTAGVGILAVAGLGIHAWNLYNQWTKGNEIEAQKKQEEQAKQLRYYNYLRQQEQLAQKKTELQQQAPPPNMPPPRTNNDYEGMLSGVDGIDDSRYHKTSRIANNAASSSMKLTSLTPEPNPTLSSYSLGGVGATPQEEPQKINTTGQLRGQDVSAPDLLPTEFSPPHYQAHQNQPPQQQYNPQSPQQTKKSQERDQEDYDQGLSPDELMSSVNNNKYY